MKIEPVLAMTLIVLGVARVSFLEGGLARRTDFVSNGERIYDTGVSRRTGPIPFRGGPMWLWMHGGGCAVCHGPRGRGGRPVMMARHIPPAIRYARLTEEHDGEHGDERHPP